MQIKIHIPHKFRIPFCQHVATSDRMANGTLKLMTNYLISLTHDHTLYALRDGISKHVHDEPHPSILLLLLADKLVSQDYIQTCAFRSNSAFIHDSTRQCRCSNVSEHCTQVRVDSAPI